MSQRIVCLKCAPNRDMHPEDVAMGFRRRIVQGKAKKPAVHEVKHYTDGELTKTDTLPTLACDQCGLAIPDGQPCVAVTLWRGRDPGTWETGFMEQP